MDLKIEHKEPIPRKFSHLKTGDVFGIPGFPYFLAIVTDPQERKGPFNALVISNGTANRDIRPGSGTTLLPDHAVELVESMSVTIIK